MKTFQHTITVSILMVALLFVSSNYLSAQVPENFEFLDHTTDFNKPGVSRILDNGIVYASHRTLTTDILFAGSDNSIINLDPLNGVEHFNSASRSKIYEINDNTYQIVLYALASYDQILPGVIVYTLCNDKVISRERFWEDIGGKVSDIVRTSTGEVWALRESNSVILASSELEILATYDNPDINSLFIDVQDRLYGLTFRGLKVFDGIEFTTIDNFDNRVYDIAESGSSKFLLLENELRQYNSDFSELLATWTLSSKVVSFNQFEFFDDHLLLAYTDDYNYIDKIYYDGNVGHEWVSNLEDTPGNITHLSVLIDSIYLTAGEYNSSNTRQSFFRSIPTKATPSYEREFVDLSSARIEQTIVEKEFIFLSNTGDSVFRITTDYDIDFEMNNQGQNDVSDIHIFGPLLYLEGPRKAIHYTFSDIINPQEITNFIFTERSSKNFVGSTFTIPGVNQRFNLGDPALVDFISSTSNPIIQASEPIYPNPASEVLFLPDNLDIQLYAIYNITGQKIYQSNWNSNEIDISDLSNGLFNLLVQTSAGNYSYTFAKH